jgi:hypothetical protein
LTRVSAFNRKFSRPVLCSPAGAQLGIETLSNVYRRSGKGKPRQIKD